MARFYDVVGYAETSVEVVPGGFQDQIVEKWYFGDVLRDARKLTDGSVVNDDLSLVNRISILADAYANEHYFAIRYVRWAGGLWTVTEVEVQAPRLILRMGGVYNGVTA